MKEISTWISWVYGKSGGGGGSGAAELLPYTLPRLLAHTLPHHKSVIVQCLKKMTTILLLANLHSVISTALLAIAENP